MRYRLQTSCFFRQKSFLRDNKREKNETKIVKQRERIKI